MTRSLPPTVDGSPARALEIPVANEATAARTAALQETGRLFYQRGWSMGTSSNYSAVLNSHPLRLLITGSGFDKGALRPEHFVVVDEAGRASKAGGARPSAETLLHVAAVQEAGAGAVLHTHSVWGTLLSELHEQEGGLALEGYEMLKGLRGIATHAHRLWLRIFPNTQDIPALARQVAAKLHTGDPTLSHGFLIARHGLYTWGRDLDEARQHVEVFEFLFEVIGRRRSLR